MTPPPTQFHLRTSQRSFAPPSAPLAGVSEVQSAVVNDSPVDCQSRDRIARRQLSAQLTEGLSYHKNYTPPVCFTASSLRRLHFHFPLRGGQATSASLGICKSAARYPIYPHCPNGSPVSYASWPFFGAFYGLRQSRFFVAFVQQNEKILPS